MKNYFQDIIDLYTNSRVSTLVRDFFYHWLVSEKHHEKKDEALRHLWNTVSEGSKTDAGIATHRSLKEVYRKIESKQQPSSTSFVRFWQYAAAILLVALLTTIYIKREKSVLYTDLIEQYVPIAETEQITLPDGTEVVMNSGSTLIYPKQFTGNARSVYLVGEAYFKVAHNRSMPFDVKLNDYQVTVLGTEFMVSAYPGDSLISTTLFSGSVEIAYNNMELHRILKPSEQFAYNKFTGEELLMYPDLSDVTAWQRDELIFKSATLEEIIATLERKYPCTFVYSSNTLKKDKYTFRFTSDTPLEVVMDIITEVSGVMKYRIEGDKCFISPK